jgi:alcohol dehydrogenase
MQGICFEDIANVRLANLLDPSLENATDCIVQVEMAGLCGSDLHPYLGREKGLDPGTVMGHEFVGKVVEVGDQVCGLNVGDRVFSPFTASCGKCFYCLHHLTSRCCHSQLFGWRTNQQGLHGGQAEFVRVPLADSTLCKVPPEMSMELALLLGDNLSTGFFAADLADVKPEGTYAIIGCGAVGLMALFACSLRGCKNVIAVDPLPERIEMAGRMGASITDCDESAMQAVSALTDGRGADGVIELVGSPAAQRLAYHLVRPGGVIATVGCNCEATFSFSPVEAYDKNLTFRTGRCPARHYMQQLIHLPEIRRLDIRPLVTHYFGLKEGARAYEMFSGRRDGIIKGVFDLR